MTVNTPERAIAPAEKLEAAAAHPDGEQKEVAGRNLGVVSDLEDKLSAYGQEVHAMGIKGCADAIKKQSPDSLLQQSRQNCIADLPEPVKGALKGGMMGDASMQGSEFDPALRRSKNSPTRQT